MRETVRSLRLYFILSGLAELWLQSVVLVSNEVDDFRSYDCSCCLWNCRHQLFPSFPLCGCISSSAAADFIGSGRDATLRKRSMVSCEFSTRLFQHWPSLGRGWPRPRPVDRLVLAQKCPAIDAGSAGLVVNYLAPSHFFQVRFSAVSPQLATWN